MLDPTLSLLVAGAAEVAEAGPEERTWTMMLDPTLIRRDMQPDEVLRAMLPVVRDAFAEPIAMEFMGDPFVKSSLVGYMLPSETWATSFAARVLPPLAAWLVDPVNTDATDLDRALIAFRDAWCDAAEKQTKETT